MRLHSLFLLIALLAAPIALCEERAVADGSDALPYVSRSQSQSFVPPLKPVADADRSSCLINMACFCEGPMDVWGFCRGSSICKPNAGDYCAYWYDDPTKCTTMTEAECNRVQ